MPFWKFFDRKIYLHKITPNNTHNSTQNIPIQSTNIFHTLKPCRNPIKYGDNQLHADTSHAYIILLPRIKYSGKKVHFKIIRYGVETTVNTGFPHTQNNALKRTRIAIFPFIYRTFTKLSTAKIYAWNGVKIAYKRQHIQQGINCFCIFLYTASQNMGLLSNHSI